MSKVPLRVRQKIDSYLKLLSDNNIPIKSAILFGSYANGTYNEWSDIDIALVSDIFIGDRIADKNIIRKITLQAGSEIEPMPFSSSDFVDDNPFVKAIISTGIRIK